jgi:hypothetical protein
VLRKIFGLKRDEVTGGWRKLHNEELHYLYPSLNAICRACSSNGQREIHVCFCGKDQKKDSQTN